MITGQTVCEQQCTGCVSLINISCHAQQAVSCTAPVLVYLSQDILNQQTVSVTEQFYDEISHFKTF